MPEDPTQDYAPVMLTIVSCLDRNRCPATLCSRRVPSGGFLCREHWPLVPYLLQQELRANARVDYDRWIATAVEALRVVNAEVGSA